MTKKIKDNKAKATGRKLILPPVETLFDFLLSKAGGEQAALREFARDRVNGLPKGMALRKVMAQAAAEGWGEMLEAMTLGDLRGTVKAPSKAGPRKPRGAAKAMRQSVMEALFGYKKTPLSTKEVALHLGDGVDSRAVARALSELVKSGAVVRTGSKRDSKYSAV